MTNDEFMTPPELHRLTNAARSAAQCEWLQDHGVPYKLDGKRVIVSRFHVRAWLEGRTIVSSSGPNWSAMSRA